MERRFSRQTKRAFTLIELLVVLAVLAILGAMVDWGVPRRAKDKALRTRCQSNLKQVGLAFRIWVADQQVRFPMAVLGTNGGTFEWVDGGNAFRHLQVMSNELSNTKILVCPSDNRISAAGFESLQNANLSYFVGLDPTSDDNPQMLLTGDRNITNGLAPKHTILALPPDRPSGWTGAMHVGQGHVGLADGSVQFFSTLALREALQNTGDATNRIALPE